MRPEARTVTLVVIFRGHEGAVPLLSMLGNPPSVCHSQLVASPSTCGAAEGEGRRLPPAVRWGLDYGACHRIRAGNRSLDQMGAGPRLEFSWPGLFKIKYF